MGNSQMTSSDTLIFAGAVRACTSPFEPSGVAVEIHDRENLYPVARPKGVIPRRGSVEIPIAASPISEDATMMRFIIGAMGSILG